jgi:hypothetical protein
MFDDVLVVPHIGYVLFHIKIYFNSYTIHEGSIVYATLDYLPF